jgi:FKBP-type peptidyl-prolyl cis-trans isomerase FklB
MHTLTKAATLLATGALVVGNALAQTPAATPKPATTTKSKTSSAAKPHTAAHTKTHGAATPAPLATQKAKFSYALGMNLGGSLHRQSVEVDPNLLMQGLKDGLTGAKSRMTEEEAHAAITEVQNDIRKKMQAQMQVLGEANKKEGAAFLAANKTKAGIVTLPSGLQYKILREGSGPKPTAADTVVCNYRGTLINGTEFDSSQKHGQPVTFPVSGVIKGWTEALQLMPVGSKWQLYIPSELAYGAQAPGEIGPDSTLIFDVELLSIQEKKP